MNNFPFNGQVFTNDIAVNDSNPKVQWGGTETGALYFEDVEIAGTFYLKVQNAAYNKWANAWVLIDPTKAAYAITISSGVMTFLTSPIGVTPFTVWQSANGGLTSAKFAVDSSGNVTTPGNISAANLNASGALAVAGNATVGGTETVTGSLSAASLAVSGRAQASSNLATASYLPPVYTAAGVAVASTAHIVQGTVTAAGASTTVTLVGAANFASATSYSVLVYDTTANAYTVLTSQTASTFVFASTTGHVYLYFAIGT